MQKLLKSGLHLLLYSNLFIAACAVALCLQTFALQDSYISWWLIIEVFAATQSVYALHRLVSLKRLSFTTMNQRFQHIRALKILNWVLLGICIIVGFWGFWQLSYRTQLALLLPAVLSVGYVLPIWKNKRLRDFHFIKIFLIAIVWSYVTVFLPAMELGLPIKMQLMANFIERAIFIFAITIPFDIRDLEIEKKNAVLTIPELIGVQNSIYLALIVLLCWIIFNYFLYSIIIAHFLAIVGGITALIIWNSYPQKEDWYYTALLDGTMLFQGMLIYFISNL